MEQYLGCVLNGFFLCIDEFLNEDFVIDLVGFFVEDGVEDDGYMVMVGFDIDGFFFMVVNCFDLFIFVYILRGVF